MNPILVDANRTNVDTAAPSSQLCCTVGKKTKMCLLSPADAPTKTTMTLSSAAQPPAGGSKSVVHLRSLSSASFDLKKKKTSSPTTRKIRRSASAKKTTVAVTRRPSDASSMSCRSAASAGSEGSHDTKCGDAVRPLPSARPDAEKKAATPTERRPRRSEEEKVPHPLYLHRNRESFTCSPISFEDGMTPEECDEMSRRNGWDARRRASPVDSQQALASSDGGRVSMLGRLRKLSLGPPSRPSAKSIDKEEKTVSTSASFSSIDSISSHSSSHSTSLSDGSKKKTTPQRFAVSFSPTVTIHPVPSAALYPQEVFESIWRGKREWRIMKRTARREWEYDAEDWRLAPEEDGFVRDGRTGRMVHPAHVHAAGARRRRGAVRRRAPVANAA